LPTVQAGWKNTQKKFLSPAVISASWGILPDSRWIAWIVWITVKGAENPAGQEPVVSEPVAVPVKALRLNDQRLNAVLAELKACGAKSILDMGCGEGNLLRLLLKEKCFTAIAGTDVAIAALNKAAERLNLDNFNEKKKKRIALFQSSLCYRDKRFKNYDVAAIVEVIEHLDENRVPALEAVVFADAAPGVVVVTTPNADYNVHYQGLMEDFFRHGDHRFEWNRDRFRAWADSVAARFAYSVRYADIGEQDDEQRTPTQMAVFRKNAPQKTSPLEGVLTHENRNS
jgi:3' terminal RNA ribose 2'-O-methyltransferase Hen1